MKTIVLQLSKEFEEDLILESPINLVSALLVSDVGPVEHLVLAVISAIAKKGHQEIDCNGRMLLQATVTEDDGT